MKGIGKVSVSLLYRVGVSFDYIMLVHQYGGTVFLKVTLAWCEQTYKATTAMQLRHRQVVSGRNFQTSHHLTGITETS